MNLLFTLIPNSLFFPFYFPFWKEIEIQSQYSRSFRKRETANFAKNKLIVVMNKIHSQPFTPCRDKSRQEET